MTPLCTPVPPLTQEETIRDQLGPLIFGYLFNVALCGVLAAQVYTYHVAFPKDRLYIKCLVYVVFTLELTQSILIMRDTYVTYVLRFGVFESVYQKGTFYWFVVPIFSGIVGCLVQISYAYRIYTLSMSKLIFWAIVLLAFVQLVSSIVTGVTSYKAMADLETVVSDCHKFTAGNTSNIVWGLSTILCDVTITLCMSHLLSRLDPGFKSTKILISKIVRMTMETGAITAAAGLMYVILVVCGPIIGVTGSYYIMIAAIMGKLYSNSLLVIFNSRAKISSLASDRELSEFVVNSDLFGSRNQRLAFRRSITLPDASGTFGIPDGSEVELGSSDLRGEGGGNMQKGKARFGASLEPQTTDDLRLMDPRAVPARTNPPKIDPGVHGFVFIR